MPYKLWIEIEEVDEDGEPINKDTDYSFQLPFDSSAACDTLQEALNTGVLMHNAVNNRQVDFVTAKGE